MSGLFDLICYVACVSAWAWTFPPLFFCVKFSAQMNQSTKGLMCSLRFRMPEITLQRWKGGPPPDY